MFVSVQPPNRHVYLCICVMKLVGENRSSIHTSDTYYIFESYVHIIFIILW